ncbi:MAG TPA: ABC transporter ATP-binding protein [Candidatus Binatia bacterium]
MIVAASSVSKRFGNRLAVDRLTLEVPAGVCYGLLGPNGAGKTTTLRMIYGVTRPTQGKVTVFGMDIAREPRAVKARLGVTLQQNVFVEALSPRENLQVFGRYYLLGDTEIATRAKELIDFFELGGHADLPVQALSGGLQRRLAIALSLINRPELLILDEPSTGLDPAVRLALWSRIRDLQAAGTTVLITTHYMDEAQRLCDRVAIVSSGRVVEEGKPADLIVKHLARETVELDCTAEEERSLLDPAAPIPKRLRAGRRLILYVEDAAPVIETIRSRDTRDGRALVVRPTNLEDVFLAVTGTRLEGDQ